MNCAKIIFSIAILFASSRLWGLTWHYGESYRVGYDDYIEIVPEYSFYDTLIPTIPATTQGYISIPTSLKGRPVAGIGNRAFWGCSKLTEVNIPSGIVYIDLLAFNRCSGLEKVIISETVNDIGKQAFNKATSLKTIIFKGNAPAIGDNAFSSVNSLCTAYVMPSSTGWNVAIPGEWNGIKIAYMKSVNFNPNPTFHIRHLF